MMTFYVAGREIRVKRYDEYVKEYDVFNQLFPTGKSAEDFLLPELENVEDFPGNIQLKFDTKTLPVFFMFSWTSAELCSGSVTYVFDGVETYDY